MSETDNALVVRVVAKKDRMAFELLVQRYQSPIRNFLRRLTRENTPRADDLAQEVFLKAYRSLANFRNETSFKNWLYRIAYNGFLNDERKHRNDAEFDESIHSSNAENWAYNDDLGEVNQALASLSLRQQAVFDLHYKKGMTHIEVAEALQLPLGTVKSDLNRGLRHLKEIFNIQELS